MRLLPFISRTTDGGPEKRGRGFFKPSKNSIDLKNPRPLFSSAPTVAPMPERRHVCICSLRSVSSSPGPPSMR